MYSAIDKYLSCSCSVEIRGNRFRNWKEAWQWAGWQGICHRFRPQDFSETPSWGGEVQYSPLILFWGLQMWLGKGGRDIHWFLSKKKPCRYQGLSGWGNLGGPGKWPPPQRLLWHCRAYLPWNVTPWRGCQTDSNRFWSCFLKGILARQAGSLIGKVRSAEPENKKPTWPEAGEWF